MNRPRICLSLFGTTNEILQEVQAARGADLFEVRLDMSSSLDLQRIRAEANRPLLIASHEKPELLGPAGRFADYIDIGPGKPSDPRHVVSIHATTGDPVALWRRYAMDEHISKIVLQTEDYTEIAALLRLHARNPGRIIAFAMGDAGAFSRVLSGFRGAPWIYASAPGRPTAAGQFTLADLADIYHIRRFAAGPKIFGIVGDPVSHSQSPAFHNGRFADANLPWLYLPFRCKDLPALFRHAEEFGISGLSITHPHKQAAAALLDSASDEVRLLQSCNTVCRRDGKWRGINTDIQGIHAVLRDVPLTGRRFVIVGAGSSARAVALVVRKHVRELHILNRSHDKAAHLAAEYGATPGSLEDLQGIQWDILFQTTPVGLREGECPVDTAFLRPGATVIDAIYNPPQTELLRRAAAIGCRTRNGEAWFAAQAQGQFEWWKEVLGAEP